MPKQICLMLTVSLLVVFSAWTETRAVQNSNQPASLQQQSEQQRNQTPAQSSPPAPQQPGQRADRVFGTVGSVGVDRFEIKKMDGTTQTVMVDEKTRYREGPRRPGQQDAPKDLQLEDLKPGDRVFVQGQTNDHKEFVASVVARVTEQEIQRFSGERAFGEIVSIDGNQLKVNNPWQGEKTIVVNDQTQFMKEGQPITLKDLKAGDRIFAMGKETNGQFLAARVMTGRFRPGGPQPEREPQKH